MVAASDEWKQLRARIGHVARDVQKVLKEPDPRDRKADRLALSREGRAYDQRNGQLSQRPAIEARRSAQDSKDHMPRLMENQIRVIDNKQKPIVIGLQQIKQDTEADRCAGHLPGRYRLPGSIDGFRLQISTTQAHKLRGCPKIPLAELEGIKMRAAMPVQPLAENPQTQNTRQDK